MAIASWHRALQGAAESATSGDERQKAGKRDTVISPEEFEHVLSLILGDDFKDLLCFAWEWTYPRDKDRRRNNCLE